MSPSTAPGTGEPHGRHAPSPQKPQHESATPEETATPTTESEAAAFETQHVHDVYETIAPHFSATRHTPWPQVCEFLNSLPSNALIADIGCGNGKYMLAAISNNNREEEKNDMHRSIQMIGLDSSPHLTQLAAKAVTEPDGKTSRHADVGVGNTLEIPLRDGVFDAALSIAVIHHLSTRARRIRAIQETTRVLRPSGKALIYVWAQERTTPDTSTTDDRRTATQTQQQVDDEEEEPRNGKMTDGRRRRRRTSKMTSRRFANQDMLIPWHMRRKKGDADSERILGDWEEVHRRFYHVYKAGELESEIQQVGDVKLLKSYYDHQNWCAIVEKQSCTGTVTATIGCDKQ